eukprot:TRINITY_DN411_c0_g1_i4.p1 TRINITY_DN411_c0_g1~~TRINITY_DN411_c0_g1_i4.p1  ORF type:complete len:345 (+),score=52.18 TRINITY_DN411_c0_g1_i4:1095-2129(+)
MTICGTGEWMAPEIILGNAYSPKADVFSFGIVVCEIISRKKITTALQRSALDAFGLDVDKFLALVPPDCPRELQEIALECCIYEPDYRPHFKQLIPRLSTLLKSLPVSDPAPAPKPTPKSAPTPKQSPPATENSVGRPAAAGAGGGVGRPGSGFVRPTAKKGGAQDLISQNAKAVMTPQAAPKPAAPAANTVGTAPHGSSRPSVSSPTTQRANPSAVPVTTTPTITTPATSTTTTTTPVSATTTPSPSSNSTLRRARPPPRPMTLYGVEGPVIPTTPDSGDSNGSGFYSYQELKNNPPKGVDKADLPSLLEPSEFPTVFGMTKEEYMKLPRWKQIAKKSEAGLF